MSLLAELAEFIRIPSVSGDPRRAGDVRRCAEWLVQRLRRAGLANASLLPTSGQPVVRATWRGAPGRPTVLVYGHYDVQPPGSRAGWRAPPFEPRLEGERLFGRGASDDKGPLLAQVAALEGWLSRTGRLPVNVVCVFEGEEEVGSPGLTRLLATRPDLFAADLAVVSDTQILGPDQPAITCALRGLISLELEVRGPAHDLHPGAFGGAVQGAADVLARLIARLHDRAGRVAVPGFYDQVRAVAPRPAAGGPGGWGEPGFNAAERVTIRPALTTTSLLAGQVGPNYVAAIPATAHAHLDVRLVPDQEPREIVRCLRAFMRLQTPAAAAARLRVRAAAPPAVIDVHHPALAAASAAYRRGFGVTPRLIRSGGTIPFIGHLRRTVGLPVVLMGFSLPGDGRHAPDEHLHVPTFWRGVTTAAVFLEEVADRLSP